LMPLLPVLFSFGDVKVIDDGMFGKLIFRIGRHRHPMLESELVLQRKATILHKHHAQVGYHGRF